MSRPPDVKAVFRRAFGFTPPLVFRVPGQLDLLGAADDFNHSLMLAVAVDRYCQLAAAPRQDGRVELVSAAAPDRVEKFWISDLAPGHPSGWLEPLRGVLAALRQRGVHFGGFNAAFLADFPPGLDLGGEAALAVATALLVRQLHPHRLTEQGCARPPLPDRSGELPALGHKERLHTARLCQAACPPGRSPVGPLAALFAREFHALQVDLLHDTTEALPLIGEFCPVLCHAVEPTRLTCDPPGLRAVCEAAARKLRARSLRSVELRHLKAHQALLTRREYECAYHVVGENLRVAAADRALREGDLGQLGLFLRQSHESARDHYRTTTTDQDLLVEIARDLPACLGARSVGGPFGIATLHLVAWLETDSFMRAMRERFHRITGRELTTTRCRLVDGADQPRRRTVLA